MCGLCCSLLFLSCEHGMHLYHIIFIDALRTSIPPWPCTSDCPPLFSSASPFFPLLGSLARPWLPVSALSRALHDDAFPGVVFFGDSRAKLLTRVMGAVLGLKNGYETEEGKGCMVPNGALDQGLVKFSLGSEIRFCQGALIICFG